MEFIVDFSFQKWTKQCLVRIFPLSERSICVFHIHHFFIGVIQVMRSCRQISRLQLTVVAKGKK